MTTSERTFGRYELLGTLGEGGFATVYRAWDPMLTRQVALKILFPHLAADPDVRRRFHAEASALSSLRHPNIVTFYNIDEIDGRPYFTMELIEGPTLASLLAGQELVLDEALRIMAGLCSAVDYLHAAGFVHRDIKASNVMLDPSSRVVLMDFGVARALDQTQYTLTGVHLGTPVTMAPEQVLGQEVGPPADIYALGILAYQLLSGRPPFLGTTAHVLYSQAHEPPPSLASLRPGLPQTVYHAIHAALEKIPAQRPASAQEFARLLAAVEPPTPTTLATSFLAPLAPDAPARRQAPAMRIPRPGIRAAIAGAAAVVVLLGLVLGIGLARRSSDVQTPALGTAVKLASANRQHLTTILAAEPTTLDPQRASLNSDISVIKQIYRGLLYIDKNDPTQVIPAAAKEAPSIANGGISTDGKTYTLHLNSGLKWQDGSPLTARDFEYSIKRLFDPKLASDYASLYFNIAGSQAYHDALGTAAAPRNSSPAELAALRAAVGVQATDDLTLVIKLDNPQPTFNTLLTLWPVFPVKKAQIDKYGDRAFAEAVNIVGDGPFKLSEWDHNDHITLTKSGNWWGQDKPTLNTITLRNISSDAAVVSDYRAGELDFATIPSASVQTIKSDAVLSKQVIRQDEQMTTALELNVSQPPFDDINVRHALSEAIDRDALIKDALHRVGSPAYSWLPPGVPDYDPSLGQNYKFDPAKARADLAQSKYHAALPGITLTYRDDTDDQAQAQNIQQQIHDNLGIVITLNPVDSSDFNSDYEQSNFQMALDAWTSDYADPEDWIPATFGIGRSSNKLHYSNQQVDDYIKQAATSPDNAKRLDDYRQAQALIVEDMPMIFLFYGQEDFLIKATVHGIVTTGLDGEPGDWFYTNLSIIQPP